jgi:hypothetical protein
MADNNRPPRWVVREYNYATKEETFKVKVRRADTMERTYRTLLAEHKVDPADVNSYVAAAKKAFAQPDVQEFEAIIGLYAITIQHLPADRSSGTERNPQ